MENILVTGPGKRGVTSESVIARKSFKTNEPSVMSQ